MMSSTIQGRRLGRHQHKEDRALVSAAKPFEAQLTAMTHKHPGLLKSFGRFSNWISQMGTLGGGNHFIEICLDENNGVWVMLHSGSRGIGNGLADYFIELARKDMEPVYQKLAAYLETPEGEMKLDGVRFCYLPLEVAMKNAHHDEPGFWEKWAEDF